MSAKPFLMSARTPQDHPSGATVARVDGRRGDLLRMTGDLITKEAAGELGDDAVAPLRNVYHSAAAVADAYEKEITNAIASRQYTNEGIQALSEKTRQGKAEPLITRLYALADEEDQAIAAAETRALQRMAWTVDGVQEQRLREMRDRLRTMNDIERESTYKQAAATNDHANMVIQAVEMEPRAAGMPESMYLVRQDVIDVSRAERLRKNAPMPVERFRAEQYRSIAAQLRTALKQI